MNPLQTQPIAMPADEDGTLFAAIPAAPTGQARVYILGGEVLEWHKGNTAERMLIAMDEVKLPPESGPGRWPIRPAPLL